MRDAHGSFVFLGTLLSVHLKLLMYEHFIHPRMGTVLPFFQLSQVLPHAGMKCTRKTWNIPGRDRNYAGMIQWILVVTMPFHSGTLYIIPVSVLFIMGYCTPFLCL